MLHSVMTPKRAVNSIRGKLFVMVVSLLVVAMVVVVVWVGILGICVKGLVYM